MDSEKGGPRAEAFRHLGNALFKSARYEDAVSAYREGLTYIPNHLLLHCNLAQTYIKLEKYDAAVHHASLATDLDPTYWKGYARLAKALFEVGLRQDSHAVLMRGLIFCADKEELRKCFIEIPGTSKGEVNVNPIKKPKKVSEDTKKDLPEKKCLKLSENKMEKNHTSSSKAKSSVRKKPVDFQDIKNDEFLALAEQSSNEKFACQRKEFEKLLDDGYAAVNEEAFKKALDYYKKALRIMEEVPLKYLGLLDKQCIVLTYIHNLVRIKTNTYENLLQTINDLKGIDEVGQFRTFPAFYYIRSLAYFKMNRYKVALEELESCKELISIELPFTEHCWPATNVVIKETTKEGLQETLSDLMMQAKSCLQIVPTATCRFAQCHEVSSHILPSELIFITDPDFDGYVTVTCEEKCHVQYHLQCWKVYREHQSEFEKIADKDMLGKPCPTTDCLNSAGKHSTIVMVEIYDRDGAIKTQIGPIAAAAKQQSKNKKKKEDCKSAEEKKDKEKVAKARKHTQRKSKSDNKSVEPKSSLKPKKESEEIFNEKIGQLLNLRAINFGYSSNYWSPNEAFYGRSDEKELCNSFKLKRVDNPLFVPNPNDPNDQQTFIRMKFFRLLSKEPLLIDAVEEHWKDDDEFSSEIRKCLNGKSIVDFLLQSTYFTLLDDLMCTSENLPEAYKETEETIEEFVTFIIEGFTEAASENKIPKEAKEIQSNKAESNEVIDDDGYNKEVEFEYANEEVEFEYDSESSEGSDGESSQYYESSDNCQSDSEVENETTFVDLDRSLEHEERLKKTQPAKCSDEDSDPESEEVRVNRPKAFLEQSVQTDNDEENSDKNVIENMKKKIELFNEKLIEKSEKLKTLEAELSKSNSSNQKLESENTKLLDQKEKLHKKLTNQSTSFQKKEAALLKEIEQLKIDGKKTKESFALIEKNVETLIKKFQEDQSLHVQSKLQLEQSILDLKNENEKLELNYQKILKEGCERTLELLEKKCDENILDLEVLSNIKSVSCHKRITDLLKQWNRFKLKLKEARKTMMKNGTDSDLIGLIESVQREEPQRLPLLSILRGETDSLDTPDTENAQPEEQTQTVNVRKNENRKTENVETLFLGAASAQIDNDDDDDDDDHSIDVLPNLHRPESVHNVFGNSHAPPPVPQTSTHSKSGAVQSEGVWEVSGKHRIKPDVVPTTSVVKKRQFTVLKEKLHIQYPNKTESELEECIRTVRARNNNSLTGLRINEIEYRVGKLLEERSKKPSTMGLDKFGKVGWCHTKPAENIWSGNIELQDCIICSEEIDQRNLTTLECHHYFHTECIRKWLKEKSICPLCTTFTKMPDEFPAL